MSRFSFEDEKKQRFSFVRRIILSLVFFAGVFVLFLYATGSLSQGNIDRQAENLKNALNRNIIYHYATTGSYPTSLKEIEDTYGLIYDPNLFFVDYKVFGQNIVPDVTIIKKEQ